MKKHFLVLVCACLLGTVNAQEQWSMFSKVTATWCSNCGSWGWDMFEEGLDAMENRNVLSWTLHYSGDLRNPTAEAIADNFNANGQPVFFVNNDNMFVNPNNISNKVAELEETVNLLNAFAPFAAVDVNAAYDGYKLYGDAAVEYLDDSPGNYYLSHYLIKDHIINPQTNQGSMADHRFVLIDHFGDAVFGELIFETQADAGETYTTDFSMDLEIADEDVADYYVATVLWNQISDGSYRVFNLDVDQVENLPSSVADESFANNYEVIISNNHVQITPKVIEAYSVELLTIDGKVLNRQRANGSLTIPIQEVKESVILARIISGNKQYTQRFFIK